MPQGTGGNTSTSMPIAIIRDQLLPWSRVGIIFLEGIQSSHRMVSTQLLLKNILVPLSLDPAEKNMFIIFICFVSKRWLLLYYVMCTDCFVSYIALSFIKVGCLLNHFIDLSVQSTPNNSNLHGKEKVVRVTGSLSYRG